MNDGAHHARAQAAPAPTPIAPDCSGLNFFRIDAALQQLLSLYLPEATLAALRPHMDLLGALAGGPPDELARVAHQHPPVPPPRDPLRRQQDRTPDRPPHRAEREA